MNVRNLLLTALAASMALVSCDKSENDVSVPTDKSLKSVTIKLPNITKAVGTRVIGDAMTTTSDRKAVLMDFKVLFLAGEQEMYAPAYDADGDGTSEAQTVYFSEGNIPTEITYHFLDASINRIVVVGNLGADVTYADITTGTAATQNILNDGDTPNDGNEHPLYPLYGEDDLALKSPLDGDEAHDNVYEATVTLAPKMSRFEIVGVGYTLPEGETTAQFESLRMNKIALCHYYTQYSFATGLGTGEQPGCPEGAHVWQWIDDAQTPWADKVVSNAETPAAISVELGKHVNIATGTELEEADLASPTLGDGFKDIITYGVAGVNAKENNAELYLSFYGVKQGQDDTPLYVKGTFTAKNTGGNFEAGKIYRILFTIPDGSWATPERCVELTVDVADWTVEVLTPNLNN